MLNSLANRSAPDFKERESTTLNSPSLPFAFVVSPLVLTQENYPIYEIQ